ncbi:hypothetical protein AWJ20_1352 [Sugiyamaella lignohabitans]|uniref:PCI domain-containing protein n=1 Tax=Sugiyamaella lignohabitans TaxID=796027 RepID=A0A167DMI8_9ASCO|nr:uncharacterized protein AWJ20_1352 [Sugiyamaella lignohabitans]ANB13073.1 hypothetical protein AWJ20_1352 [Sugiyamaella lignohabitans]
MEQLLTLYRASGDNINPTIIVDLINRSLALPGVYTLVEFDDLIRARVESSANLKADRSIANHLELLDIFVYGTWAEYIGKSDTLPKLTKPQATKLKQLSLAILGASSNVLSFDTIAKQLDLSESEIEKFLIDCIYSDVCVGLIDSKNRRFEIKSVIARDVSSQRLAELESLLDKHIQQTSYIISENKTAASLLKEQAGERHIQVQDYRKGVANAFPKSTTHGRGPSF